MSWREKTGKKGILLIVLMAMLAAAFCMPQTAAAKSAKPAKPAKVGGLTVKTTYNSVTLKWKKASHAKKYVVYRAVGDGKYKEIAKTKKRKYKDKDLKTGTSYRYKVQGINKKRHGKKSKAVSAVPKLSAPQLSVVETYPSRITLEVDGTVAGAEGYIFYRDGQELAVQEGLSFSDTEGPEEQEVTYTAAAYRTVDDQQILSGLSKERKAARPKLKLSIWIEPEWVPSGQLLLGQPFTIKGQITSNVDIYKVKAGVRNKETGKWVKNVYHTCSDYDTKMKQSGGDPQDFRILKQIDSHVHFGNLTVGDYNYRVIVTLADGTKQTMVDQDFQVIEPDYPDPEVTGGAKKIKNKAKKLAWPYGTAKSVYKFSGGSPTDAFKEALEAAYPNRSSWSKKPRKGASCDVFVGTVVRATGYDPTFPRGLDEVEGHMKKYPGLWKKYTNIKSAYDMQPGDIIYQIWKTDGTKYGHIMIYIGDGKVANAHYGSGGQYGIIQKASSQIRTETSSRKIKKFYVYRAVK